MTVQQGEMMVTHSPSMVERSLQRRIRRLAGLLIAMSLVPGIALAVSSDNWRLLPPNARWSAYLLSVVLLFAAWSLLRQEGAAPAGRPDQERSKGDPRVHASG
ncbi:MAG TPA: hypothetical protein VJ808_12955, partial [Gemmatimonadales bacterium]|nr:hypothetical protein [Gemmatimonadales bacterium]